MTHPHPFRFGLHTGGNVTSATDWRETARKAEALGYDILTVSDHFTSQLAFAPLLLSAANVTHTLHIGTFVLDNDFRHPAIVAADAAMLDLFSDRRFELGLGAGWMREDYDLSGIPFDTPGVRFRRLTESVQIVKTLFAGDAVTLAGEHYTIAELQRVPKPEQVPLLLGGGGPRMLAFAAREANIISLISRSLPEGGLDNADLTTLQMDEKVNVVREAAGERFDQIELNTLLQRVIITDDVDGAAAALAERWGNTPTNILDSPYILIGSVERITETLQARRERHGISYITVFERDSDAFAPVVARLAGT